MNDEHDRPTVISYHHTLDLLLRNHRKNESTTPALFVSVTLPPFANVIRLTMDFLGVVRLRLGHHRLVVLQGSI
jgi:hypothetical protein